MNIFKKRPGGAPFWNLVRGIGDKFTGGLISNIIPQTPKNANLPAPASTSSASIVAGDVKLGADGAPVKTEGGFAHFLKSKWMYIVGSIIGLIGLWYFFLRGGHGHKAKRRY